VVEQGSLGLLKQHARIVRMRVARPDSITGAVTVTIWARMGTRMSAQAGVADTAAAALEAAAQKFVDSWGLADAPGR
jgi:hypothetical protein